MRRRALGLILVARPVDSALRLVWLQAAQIAPPAGCRRFVLLGRIGRELAGLARAALPFVGLLLLSAGVIYWFPQRNLRLPGLL